MKRNDADDETNAQHHDDEGVDLEAGALVGVELEHCRAAAASAGGAGARGAGIGDFVGAVGGCAAADGGRGASWGFGRGRACGCAARGGGRDGGVGGLGRLFVSRYILGGRGLRARCVDLVLWNRRLRTIVKVIAGDFRCFVCVR